MTLSASGLYNVDDGMITEYGAVSEMKIGGKTKILRENLPQYHPVHHTSHMT
jgi:hypothetical protein